MAMRLTEAGSAGSVGAETTDQSVAVEADCDQLAVAVPHVVRSEADVYLLRPTDGVDTGVRECQV